MNSIGLATIVKDESYFLPRFLDNIRGLFDDYVFIDGGSTDSCVELIKNEGYNVVVTPVTCFNDRDFGKFRNFAISMLKTKWAFVLDVDEYLGIGVKKFISCFDQNQPSAGFAFFRDNYLDGGNIDDAPLDFPIRMFPSHIRYQGKIHEKPLLGTLPVQYFLGGRIYHKKDSWKCARMNLLCELSLRGEKEIPTTDVGVFNIDGKLRKVSLLLDREYKILNEELEGEILNR